eukprot:4422735-Pleurochrysis_carterae.AAC.1
MLGATPGPSEASLKDLTKVKKRRSGVRGKVRQRLARRVNKPSWNTAIGEKHGASREPTIARESQAASSCDLKERAQRGVSRYACRKQA